MLQFWTKSLKPQPYVLSNDAMAIGAIKALQENNIKIPKEESAVIGLMTSCQCHDLSCALSSGPFAD